MLREPRARLHRCCLILFAALLLAPTTVWAQSEQDPAKVAQGHKEAAYGHLQQGEYRAAIEELEKAYGAVPHPTFLYNIAVAQQQWGESCGDTLAAFDRFLEACGECEARGDAETKLQEVRQKCGSRIETIPTEAQVEVEGKRICRSTPCSFYLPKKTYEVVVKKEGYQLLRQPVEVFPGSKTELRLQPVPPGAEAPPEVMSAEVAPEEATGEGGGVAWGWLAVSAGMVGGGIALDLAPETARNGELDALDFLPVALYGAAAAAALLGILPAL